MLNVSETQSKSRSTQRCVLAEAGIRPVGVWETWRQLMVKCLLKVPGPEANSACGTNQLASGLEAGIEGAIHAMRVLFEEHRKEEDWGFLLIDARNVFNEENRTAMLCTVRNEWLSGAQFTFNCYRHWATLVVRDIGDGSGHFLHSKERVTQGEPLDMISYGIGVLPLIRNLREAHPRITQPWYADDAGAGGGRSFMCRRTSKTCRRRDRPGAITRS